MEIKDAKEFFDSNPKTLEETAAVICAGFGRQLETDDIYEHLTKPDKLLLLRCDERVLAMASYSTTRFRNAESLIVEGVAMLPEIQGHGVFARMTDAAINGEDIICLRTQNPVMYRALENYCHITCFSDEGHEGMKKDLTTLRDDFAEYLGNEITNNGVIKGYYGGLFYGKEPHHNKVDSLFSNLGVDLSNGDAILAVGAKNQFLCSEDRDTMMGMI